MTGSLRPPTDTGIIPGGPFSCLRSLERNSDTRVTAAYPDVTAEIHVGANINGDPSSESGAIEWRHYAWRIIEPYDSEKSEYEEGDDNGTFKTT